MMSNPIQRRDEVANAKALSASVLGKRKVGLVASDKSPDPLSVWSILMDFLSTILHVHNRDPRVECVLIVRGRRR